MNALAHRLISASALLAWGAALCALYFSGRITSYLVPTFQPYTLACGVVLVLLAALVLVAPSAPGQESGCAVKVSPWKRLLGVGILVIPMLLALSISKDEFGATAIKNRNYVSDVAQLPAAPQPADALPGETVTPASVDDSSAPELKRDAQGNLQAEVIDLLYAAQLPDMRSTFENKSVAIIGQLMPAQENNPRGDRYDVVRMFMTCCAADAQAVAVTFQPVKKPDLPEMTWIRITGKATFPVVGGERIPLIDAAVVEKIQPPEDTMLY